MVRLHLLKLGNYVHGFLNAQKGQLTYMCTAVETFHRLADKSVICLFVCRDDDSDDEIDDQDIHKIMIVTQTPPPVKKHDRTGSYVTRVKMTQELSKAINDGLYYYEQV